MSGGGGIGRLAAAFCLAIVAGCAGPTVDSGSPPAAAPAGRNAYVVLSGGGTPLSNHYSQYLQARGMAEALSRTYPAEATWFFFGLGNRAGEAPQLADVHRESKHDGLVVPSWLPGVLPRNRPATKASFLGALRNEVLPVVRGGGTLFLFVGDHGEVAGQGDKRESAITLWQLKKGRRGGWSTDENEVLGVAELRQVLAEGLGQGRVVFCMTQCHSGGFHELAVAREMMPPGAWFSAVPDWVKPPRGGSRLRIAGFTATDLASMAAGCDPDPDPEHWAGYERFFPECLWGVDLMTGRTKGAPAASLAAAHEAAVLIDQTIDKPRTTSEHYLEAWARLIETRLATTLAVTTETQRAVAAYQRAVDTGRVRAAGADFQARQAQYHRFIGRLGDELPAARTLLATGTRRELEAAINPRGEGRGGGGGRRGAASEARRAWTETLRPAWKTAVLAGTVPGLTDAVLEFERHLLRLEDDGRTLLLGRGAADAMRNEVYWESTYAEPARLNPTRAAAVARWGEERRARVVAWGARAADPAVRAAAAKLGPGPVAAEPDRGLSRRTAAERVLYYRRVLAAWEFLVAMEAGPALAELQELIELERTPFPPPAVEHGRN